MNSLMDRKIIDTLARLHREAEGDSERWATDPTTSSDELVRMGELYLSISDEEGRLLYLLARASKAQRIIEFGASYGISTIYLAAAARDNIGRVTTTEVHPQKCAAVRDNIRSAGLNSVVILLQGDARETLAGMHDQADFVFLDGWKGLYLPMLNILKPKLKPGALVVADNVSHPAAMDYLDAVRAPDSGFVSLPMGKMELSCYTT